MMSDTPSQYSSEEMLRDFTLRSNSGRPSGPALKYVMFSVPVDPTGIDSMYFFVLFPEPMIHKEVADAIQTMKVPTQRGGWVRPIASSAGFVSPHSVLGLRVYGDSESLNLKPHPEDGVIINSYSLRHGLGFVRRGGPVYREKPDPAA